MMRRQHLFFNNVCCTGPSDPGHPVIITGSRLPWDGIAAGVIGRQKTAPPQNRRQIKRIFGSVTI